MKRAMMQKRSKKGRSEGGCGLEATFRESSHGIGMRCPLSASAPPYSRPGAVGLRRHQASGSGVAVEAVEGLPYHMTDPTPHPPCFVVPARFDASERPTPVRRNIGTDGALVFRARPGSTSTRSSLFFFFFLSFCRFSFPSRGSGGTVTTMTRLGHHHRK